MSRKAAVLSAFTGFLSAHRVPAVDVLVANANVHHADDDFVTLSNAYAKWNAGAHENGITRTMIDKQRNRIAIGVIDAAAAKEVAAAITQLGVDPAAVIIETVPLAVMNVSLQDNYRPAVGGLQIQTPVGFCTLGFTFLVRGYSVPGVDDNSAYFANYCQ